MFLKMLLYYLCEQLFQRPKIKMEDEEVEMDLHTACSLGDEEYVKKLLEM